MNLGKIVLHGESETVEFKEFLQLKDEIGESISSFSNSKGGGKSLSPKQLKIKGLGKN